MLSILGAIGLKIFLQLRNPVAYAEINNNQIIKGFVDEEGYFINEKDAHKYVAEKCSEIWTETKHDKQINNYAKNYTKYSSAFYLSKLSKFNSK